MSAYAAQQPAFAHYASTLSEQAKPPQQSIIGQRVSHGDNLELHFEQTELEEQVSKRVRELLLLLHQAPDEGLSLTALCQRLYPVHEQHLALSNTRNLIHRARRQLNRPDLILVSAGYARLDHSVLHIGNTQCTTPA